MRHRTRRHFALFLGAILAGCASAREAPPMGRYPGELAPIGSITGAFLWRQHVVGRHEGRDVGFDAAVQKRGSRLTVVGLAPWGSRAFTLVQEGTAVTFTKELDEPLPFPAESILQDIHRAWFKGLPGAPLADGTHTAASADGETITERWAGGRLLERRFRRLDDRPPGEVVVTYGDGLAGLAAPPRKVTLENGWFGYRLEVETLEAHALD